ncbi:sn-glycerol 3-phosphate transport system substrate-binding protein [Constrictibacter sp. MBR-5]|jgi:sn-glycerol 3-phosphate transport system substrate-binding protein|uniref:ABC transporter substrate-binding protein n=1 Tax=Constrictibacter sp. MBR-5 TaxID=3156467 RepID=UPI0033979DC0
MRLFNRSTLAGLATAAGLAFAAAPAAADVELTMYYPVAVGGPVTKVVDGMTAAFTKDHPDIKVTAVYAGNYDDTRTKALAALKAGQPVQLSVLFSIDLFELIDQGVIVPFEDVVKTDADKAWLDSFYPSLMANGKTQGKTWGIPFQRSTIVLYYNKDAFKEAGLDPEKAPATWADMQAMGEKLVKKDASGNVERYGVMVPSTGYPYWMFQAFAKQNGEVLMNQDGTETYFDKPKVVEALSYWRELGQKGVMPSGTVEWGTLRDQFLQGKTAMMWHTTGNLTAVRKGATFDFGVAMLPASKERGSPTGGGNFYIFEKASPAEREAALTFIKWMTAPERAAQWSIDTGYVAVTPAAYETETLKKYVADFPPAAVARDQLDHSVAEFSVHENARVKKALDDAIQATLTGGKEPKAALTEAQATADRILKRYR